MVHLSFPVETQISPGELILKYPWVFSQIIEIFFGFFWRFISIYKCTGHWTQDEYRICVCLSLLFSCGLFQLVGWSPTNPHLFHDEIASDGTIEVDFCSGTSCQISGFLMIQNILCFTSGIVNALCIIDMGLVVIWDNDIWDMFNCQEIDQTMRPCFFVKENWVRSILFVSPTSEPVLVLQMFAWGSAKSKRQEN